MPASLIIRDVTLIDGTGAPPVEGAAIAIEGGRIAAAGAGGVAVPEGAEVIDGRGLWAVPGLIDTHMHLELVGREALPVFLALGLTTIRDLGGAVDLLVEARRSLEDGVIGPRLLFTGPMVDGDPPTLPTLVRPTSDPEAAARAVQEHLDAGADAIKLYTTLPPESVRRCIQQVDGRVPVTGHLGRTLASEAMEAGINGLEHALLTPYNDFAPEELRTAPGEVMMSPGFWQKLNEGWLRADLDSDRARRWFDLLVERDVSFCPTLTVGAGLEPDEEEFRYLPGLRRRQQERAQQREAQARQAGRTEARPPAGIRERGRQVRAKLQELVGRVQRAGGRVVAGTDTGAVRSLVPGFSLHHELALLSGAGLSNMEVLRAATARAAEALRRSDLGTIEAGKQADLLLLRRDPLEEIGALREIHRIVHDGRVIDPAALLAKAREDGEG
ncbi:MAG: amidohydrolase family protein [Chloroflexi bacterium]|nr:amidohydrolase family protein [Chloroflexota bacterium]